MTSLVETLANIDQLHAMDPRIIDGTPAELSYARQMTHWLQLLEPDASEELQIAVRSQHLCRWEIFRSEYPEGRTGYLKWRTELGKLHARKATEVMARQGYSEQSCEVASAIIRKQGIKRNPDAHTLEDCACLVFLTRDFSAFAAKYPKDKVISIVQKTWKKMSEKAHQEALKLAFSDNDKKIIEEALAG